MLKCHFNKVVLHGCLSVNFLHNIKTYNIKYREILNRILNAPLSKEKIKEFPKRFYTNKFVTLPILML